MTFSSDEQPLKKLLIDKLQASLKKVHKTEMTKVTDESDDKDFLRKVDEIILELMPRGEANVENVAKALNMSHSTFRRRLTTLSSQTPLNYIMGIRMNEAKQLMVGNPQLTMQQVAERTGFADNAHFTHTFTRHFGVSPTQYLEELKK